MSEKSTMSCRRIGVTAKGQFGFELTPAAALDSFRLEVHAVFLVEHQPVSTICIGDVVLYIASSVLTVL